MKNIATLLLTTLFSVTAAVGQTPAPAAQAPAAATAPAATPAPVPGVTPVTAPGADPIPTSGREKVKDMLLKRGADGSITASFTEVRQGANDALADCVTVTGFAGQILTTRAAAREAMPLSAAGRDAARMADEAILRAWTSRVTGTESALWAYAPAVEAEASKGGVASVEYLVTVWHEDEKVLHTLENPGFFGSIWWWWNR